MSKCNAKDLLKKNNLKSTAQRLMILEKILDDKSIFSANSLFDLFRNEMDLVTIYRIISAFLDKGLIREVIGNDEVKRYEVACIHNPVHPHLYCRVCKKLFCLQALDNRVVKLFNREKNDFIVEDIAVQITGICRECRKDS